MASSRSGFHDRQERLISIDQPGEPPCHVAEQEDRIARQDVLVERLRESGSCLLDDALQLLTEMHGLDAMRDHAARLGVGKTCLKPQALR
jgi:hypothetical protein